LHTFGTQLEQQHQTEIAQRNLSLNATASNCVDMENNKWSISLFDSKWGSSWRLLAFIGS